MFSHTKMVALGRRLLVLAGCLMLLGGCAKSALLTLKRQNEREKALGLIDKGKRLEGEGSLLLALDCYNRAALIYASPEAYYKMGQVFEAQGKPQEAATAYAQALELAPDYQEARLSALALGYKPQNATPSADELDRAREWGKRRNEEIARLRANAADIETTTTVADIKGQRLEVIEEASQKALPTVAEVQAALFAPETAEEKLPSATSPVYANEQDVILATYPYHYEKAQQWRKRQLYDRAAEEYERALQADPTKIEARLELGDMLMRMNRSERARIHYERAQHDFPDNPQPYFKLGRYYAEQQQPERAREFYQKSLAKDPKYLEAYNNLGVMDMQEGKYAQAAATFDEMIRLDPSYANAYLNRGIIAGDFEKNKDLELRCYKRYVELNGPRAIEVRRWITEMENEK